MRRNCFLVLVLPALALMLCACLPAAQKTTAAPRALILSGANNHDWQSTTPVIKRNLEQAGWQVGVTEKPSEMTLADFKAHAVVVSNYNGERWGPVAEEALLQYVREGGGFVVIHAANNAFPDWPEFDRLIGGAWREGAGHGQRYAYQVKATRPWHPIVQGMPPFLHAEDEMYHRLRMQPDAVVIADAWSDAAKGGTGNREPILWVVNYGKGRVFQTVLGHDASSMSDVGFVVTLQRGAEWAATGRVTTPMPRAALLATGLASEQDDERYEAEAGLVAMGPAAIDTLFSCQDMGGRAAEAAARGLRWIAMRACATAQAEAVAKAVQPYLAADKPENVRALAVQMLGLAAVTPRIVPLLSDSALRDMALASLAAAPGKDVTIAIARSMKQGDAGYRAHALAVLETRADTAALPAVTRAARDPDPAVRAAALQALGSIGNKQSLPLLAAALQDVQNRSAAFAALLALAGGNPALAGEACHTALAAARTPAEKVAALAALAGTGKSGEWLAPYLADADETVAMAAVGRLAADGGTDARSALRRAVSEARPMVAIAALDALGRLGDEDGMGQIAAVAAGPAPTAVRVAALRALGLVAKNPTETVVNAVETCLRDEQPVRGVAVDTALAMLDGRPEGDRAAMAGYYAGLVSRATNEHQLQRALRGLAWGARPEHRALLESHLASGNADLRLAAMDGLLRIADTLATTGAKDEATALYGMLARRLPAGRRLQHAAEALGRLGVSLDLAAVRGFITKWWVTGPFPNPGNAAYETAFPPEQGVDVAATYQADGRTLAWSRHTTSSEGILDLLPLVQPPQDAAAYCYAEIESDREQPVTFKLGSDDGAVVWLNGERLFGTPEARGLTVDQDTFQGKLATGTNRILVKVLNGAADFGLCLRVLTPDGSALEVGAGR